MFTIVQDEPEFIHPWINHYRKQVSQAGDIYVLTHGATNNDGEPAPSVELSEWGRARTLLRTHHSVVPMPVHHSTSFDHQWLTDTVSSFQAFLLQSYKWVVFAEVDEFIVPNPETSWRGKSLLEYVRSLDNQVPTAVGSRGFEVVQQEEEAPLPAHLYAGGSNYNLRAGHLLLGREWWCPSELYSKNFCWQIRRQNGRSVSTGWLRRASRMSATRI